MRWLWIALGLAACSGGTPTHATAVSLPAETQARWPGCRLDHWTLTESPTRFTPPPGTLCGTTPCTGLVRGHTDTRTRTIVVWAADPHVEQVRVWEACNACRWTQTGVLNDTGCA